MSRSYKKKPIHGACGGSDKNDKTQANQNLRIINKILLKKFHDDSILKHKYEVSDEWDFSKDGKMYSEGYPKVFRK